MTLRTILAVSLFFLAPAFVSAQTAPAGADSTESDHYSAEIATTEAEAEEDEDDGEIDSIDLLWLSGGVSYQYLDLRTVDLDGEKLTADLLPTQASGVATDLGIGMRFWLASIAFRVGVGFFDDTAPNRTVGGFQLWTIDVEGALHLPLGFFQPYFLLGAGYATIGGIGDAFSGLTEGMNIDGLNLRTGVGADFFVTPVLSLGVRATVDGYFFAREGVPVQDLAEPQEVDTIAQARERLLEADQTAFGYTFSAGGTVGLHFF
jgi:hypothetical protein